MDEIVALTGLRPDLGFLGEVRLDLDSILQAPRALAPLIDPNEHWYSSVYPHGAAELAQPALGLFLAGVKSYGRAPPFPPPGLNSHCPRPGMRWPGLFEEDQAISTAAVCF